MTSTTAPTTTTAADATEEGVRGRMLGRIKLLLSKAEHPKTTAVEAEAYTAKAAELMAKYQIDHAMLAFTTNARVDQPVDCVVKVAAPYAKEHAMTLMTVAKHCGVKGIWLDSGSYAKGTDVGLVGFADDIELTQMLWTSLRVQATRDLVREDIPTGMDLWIFRSRFLLGFRSGINSRFLAIARHAREQADAQRVHGAPSAEVALRTRDDIVENVYTTAYPHTVKMRPMREGGLGGRRGYQSGQNADLGQTGVSGAGSPALAG